MPNSFEDVYDSLIILGPVEIVEVKKRPQGTLAIVLGSSGSLCLVNCVISYQTLKELESETKSVIQDPEIDLERKSYSLDVNKIIKIIKERSGLEHMKIADGDSGSGRSISHYARVIRQDPLLDYTRAQEFCVKGFVNHPSGRLVACFDLDGRDGHLIRLYDKKKVGEVKIEAEKMLLRSRDSCKLDHLHKVKDCLGEVLGFFP